MDFQLCISHIRRITKPFGYIKSKYLNLASKLNTQKTINSHCHWEKEWACEQLVQRSLFYSLHIYTVQIVYNNHKFKSSFYILKNN